jgi:hypothetical protein
MTDDSETRRQARIEEAGRGLLTAWHLLLVVGRVSRQAH